MKLKLISKKQEGGEINYKDVLDLLPIYGTIRSGLRLIQNPTWPNAASFALDFGGDLLTASGIGYLAKIKKAAKIASKMNTLHFLKMNDLVTLGWKLNELMDKYKFGKKPIDKLLYNTYNKQLKENKLRQQVEEKIGSRIDRLVHPDEIISPTTVISTTITNPGFHAASKNIEILHNNNK